MASPRKSKTRLWLPLLANLALIVVVQFLNEFLASFSLASVGMGTLNVWLNVEALFLLFPLLYLRYFHALPVIGLTALLLDAMSPVPFGLRLALYTMLMVAVLPLRMRIRRENPTHVAWLAVFVNLILFVSLLIAALLGPSLWSGGLASRAITDLLLSEAVVAGFGFFWVEFQRQIIISISGDDPAGYPINRQI